MLRDAATAECDVGWSACYSLVRVGLVVRSGADLAGSSHPLNRLAGRCRAPPSTYGPPRSVADQSSLSTLLRWSSAIFGYGLDPIRPFQSTLLYFAGGTRSPSAKSKRAASPAP